MGADGLSLRVLIDRDIAVIVESRICHNLDDKSPEILQTYESVMGQFRRHLGDVDRHQSTFLGNMKQSLCYFSIHRAKLIIITTIPQIARVRGITK